MDKSWMRLRHRYWPEYIDGIRDFIEFSRGSVDSMDRIRCPCNICNNSEYKHIDVVKQHLEKDGMDKTYTRWVYHGEDFEILSDDDDDEDVDGNSYEGEGGHVNGLEDLIADFRAPTSMDSYGLNMQDELLSNRHATDVMENEVINGRSPDMNDSNNDLFDDLLRDARMPLYPGCKTLTKLDFIVKLLHLKILNRWSNKSFNMNLELIKLALPASETLPKSYYECKAFMRNLGLGYIPIHACKHDCVLFWKEQESLQSCPTCGESRYKILEGKGKKIPHKVLRYFPLKPRLQRLFMSRMTAGDMRWHKEKRDKEENVLRHPADSKIWEEFDKKHEWFANDPRNVRLGLASDGFNPFGNMSNAYSMWPVMFMPYNLPPWKCMKEPFIFMSLLIPGPKAPGNDIDVYLRPLIDELKELWESGVETYDSVTKQTFRLHAALLWTINDFPAYANLSGWNTKGKLACPTCNMNTSSMYLKNGRKLCYMDHGRFLSPKHPLKKRRKQLFGRKNRIALPPKELSGDDLLAQLEKVVLQKFGKAPNNKKRKRAETDLNWTKKSIFFELPYWRSLKIRHNLDVMHIEKNICESILGTMLKLDNKTKDTINTRLDLEELGIREELHLRPKGDSFTIPPACYTLSPDERRKFCEWLKLVRFPDGYASNISRCVNANGDKISGMKSHDCHVFIQQLLPVVIRGLLPNDISAPLIELGIFFKELCCKTLRLEMLEKMERDIAVILCKLEEIFPPSFFDVMVHLAVHLPREAILAGPVHYRWMYPIERFLHTLKQYVRNKARPEGSIAEAYIDSECLTFCSMYLQGIETRFNREERNCDTTNENQAAGMSVFTQDVRTLGASEVIMLDIKDYNKAHYYVLNNSEEVLEYIDEHKEELQMVNSHNLQQRHEKSFAKWFEHRIKQLRHENSLEVNDELYSLACGPDVCAYRYNGCIVNGTRFHTKNREIRLRTQNSGVVTKGVHQSEEIDYYGVLTDIIELEYLYGKRVFLFKCDWWDVGNKRTGIQIDSHFTSVNISRTWYKDDQFVLATQTSQVFYVNDTKLGGSWHVVLKIKPRNVYDVLEIEEVGAKNDDDAYQEEEQLATSGIVQEGENVEASDDEDQEEVTTVRKLNRDDVIPEQVNANVVKMNKRNYEIDESFIDEDEIDEEDDTLMDYYIEEDDTASSDNDSDID